MGHHWHLVPDVPDVHNMPNVPRGAQTCTVIAVLFERFAADISMALSSMHSAERALCVDVRSLRVYQTMWRTSSGAWQKYTGPPDPDSPFEFNA